MPGTSKEGEGFQPTEYFHISPEHPELRGEKILEINNVEEPTTYIRGGKSLTQQGRGDIVIQNISDAGIARVRELIERVDDMDQVRRILTEADFIGWEKPFTGN
jgi:hypothetical protein